MAHTHTHTHSDGHAHTRKGASGHAQNIQTVGGLGTTHIAIHMECTQMMEYIFKGYFIKN